MLVKFKNQDFLGNSYFFLILFFGILIIHQIIFQQFFPNSRGLLGHDYEQFIPNLMFGKIWFYNNFLSVPWFTPSFCCGIPFYADPQSMYYSIPQIIFLIFNPILSVKIIFFILSFISYVGMFLLVRGNFKCNSYVSLLCASLFLFNGFFVYRAIAGHVDYLSYIFVPLYCYFLIKSYENQSNNSSYVYLILSSIIFANFFHSGSGPIILIIFTSILSVLLFYSHLINSFKIFFKFSLSLLLGISISLSKVTATLFFLNNFPRKYAPTEFYSFISFIKTFFLSFFLTPNEKYFNDNITSLSPFGVNDAESFGVQFGVHEMEYSVSLVPIILLFFIFFLDKKIIKLNYYNIRFFLLLVLIFSIPVFLNINFLNQFQLIEKIPILNSTWTRFRWMTIYILPIIIVSGLIIQNLNFNISQKKYLVIVMIFVLLAQNFIKDKSWHFNDQSYATKNVIDFSLKIKTDKIPEILGPAILMDKFSNPKIVNYKNDMFFYSYSPLTCYQPIFGYDLRKLPAQQIRFNSKLMLSDGSYMLYANKLSEYNGRLNLFNPSCFLFPEENNCLPGDTFKILDKEKLVKFSNYKKFEFKQNKFQIISNYISIITFMGCLLYLIYLFFIFIYNLRKKY